MPKQHHKESCNEIIFNILRKFLVWIECTIVTRINYILHPETVLYIKGDEISWEKFTNFKRFPFQNLLEFQKLVGNCSWTYPGLRFYHLHKTVLAVLTTMAKGGRQAKIDWLESSEHSHAFIESHHAVRIEEKSMDGTWGRVSCLAWDDPVTPRSNCLCAL